MFQSDNTHQIFWNGIGEQICYGYVQPNIVGLVIPNPLEHFGWVARAPIAKKYTTIPRKVGVDIGCHHLQPSKL
jgi:hypothetical protein